MEICQVKRIGLAMFLFASALPAQTAFDVVSIHVVPPNAPLMIRAQTFTSILPGGQFSDPRTFLPSLIAFAYGAHFPDREVLGLPEWAKHTVFSISAKPAEGFPNLPAMENRERVRLMMRQMLVDRFHLQVHTEERNGTIFSLELAKGGFKFKPVDAPVPPEREGFVNAAYGDNSGRMIGEKSTMSGFATALGVMLRAPVIDRTELKGYFTFDVKWRSPEERNDAVFGADGIAMLISNLQDQFGLRLTKTTGPVKYWVVDHVEMPTEN